MILCNIVTDNVSNETRVLAGQTSALEFGILSNGKLGHVYVYMGMKWNVTEHNQGQNLKIEL